MGRPGVRRARADRLRADDAVQLAFDVGPLPFHIGAVLVLDRELDAAGLAAVLRDRVPSGLGRLLVRRGAGRAWRPDAAFDVARHVTERACPAPGDDRALLRVAADVHAQPLPGGRPPWRAVAVTGLTGGRGAVVLVLHHVVADGLGGLATLAALLDGDPPAAPAAPTAPGRAAPERTSTAAGRLRAAAVELGRSRPRAAGGLLGPLSGRLALASAGVPLAPLRDRARAHGATVNDALLAAVGGVMGALLARRGAPAAHVVVSVAVGAARAQATGNRVGVMPVAVPTGGDRGGRLRAVAAATAARRAGERGASRAIAGPVFRALGVTGLLRVLVRRQRMVDTFCSNLRGPAEEGRLAGRRVTDVVPLGTVSGNVPATFTALSYAGRLTVTVAADPAAVDADEAAALLAAELADEPVAAD